MRITKHEAAVLATALSIAKYEIALTTGYSRDEEKLVISKLTKLQDKLETYETDNRLQSKSGRAYQYPSLTKIILNKLK